LGYLLVLCLIQGTQISNEELKHRATAKMHRNKPNIGSLLGLERQKLDFLGFEFWSEERLEN
jgi:hypothetical protein